MENKKNMTESLNDMFDEMETENGEPIDMDDVFEDMEEEAQEETLKEETSGDELLEDEDEDGESEAGQSSYDADQEYFDEPENDLEEEPEEEEFEEDENFEEDTESGEEEYEEEEPACTGKAASKKKKNILMAGACAGAALLLGIGGFMMTGSMKGGSLRADAGNMVLKSDTFCVEYGEEISMEASTYLKSGLEKDSAVYSPRLERLYGSDTDSRGNLLTGETPAAPGEYDCFVTTGEHMTYFVLQVEDRTPPVWEKTETSLTFDEGELRTLDLSEYFTASDISGVELKVDGDYSLSAAGNYSLRVSAVDKYGNATDAKSLNLTIRHVDTEEDRENAQKLKDYDSAVESAETLKKELESLRKENDKLRENIEDLEQIDTEKEALEKELAEAESSLKDLSDKLQDLLKEQQEKNEEDAAPKDLLDDLYGYLKDIISTGRTGR